MDWFLCLCSILLLYLSTQRALYNMLHSPVHTSTFSLLFFSFSCLTFTNIHSLKNPWTSNLGLDILPRDTETRRLRKPETEAPTLWLIAQLLYLLSPYMLHIAWVVLSQAKCCNLCTELMIIRFFFCKLTGPALSQNFWLMQNYLSICFQRQLGGKERKHKLPFEMSHP